MAKVFLTGGSGFIASHVLKILLERGYDVVTSVRSREAGDVILESYSSLPRGRLRYVIVEDIAEESALNQAVQSDPPFDYVIHTASPFTANFTDPVKDMLDPAIKGTTAVLKAIKGYAPSVRRVVLTSSFVAIFNPMGKVEVYDERSWNPVTWDEAVQNRRMTYSASKTLAEKAAWDFVKTEKPSFDIVSLNPPLVLGPLIQHLPSIERVNTSNQRIWDMVKGKFADGQLPPTGIFLWVDVRDLALSHVRAVEVPEAGGERFLVAAGLYSNKAIAEAICEAYPALRSKLPSELVDDTPADVYGFNNVKTVTTLGTSFRSLTQSVEDTVASLVKHM